jgi:hypothetical protein
LVVMGGRGHIVIVWLVVDGDERCWW